MATTLSEHELTALEAEHADGISSQELVSAFDSRGVRFSEANLPVGRHAVFMRLRAEEPWRRIGTVRLVRDRSYTVRLRAPGRLDLQMTATP